MATYKDDVFGKLLQGFSKIDRESRYKKLQELGVLSKQEAQFLRSGAIQSLDLAENFIENVIGYFQLPLGVATNFKINGKDYVIPLAVEETSIIAAASKQAKWIRKNGRISTRSIGNYIIGQIQIAKAKNPQASIELIEKNRFHFIDLANQNLSRLVARGGGVFELTTRIIDREDGDKMIVIHIMCDPCEAMGANMINQACEALKPHIESVTGEEVTMCILSNLVDTRLTESKVEIFDVEEEVGLGIAEASLFAKLDPYRAATNNKGVLNGIDPVLIATGNDWRAVEAGVHAYAARDGQYRSITDWQYENGKLTGSLVAPIVVGTVGGVTSLHPTAQICMSMLGYPSAKDLSGIIASVGLVQNLGALRALSSVGIVEGHMKLHAANLALAAGAQPEAEFEWVKKELQTLVARVKRISLEDAKKLIREYRNSEARSNL